MLVSTNYNLSPEIFFTAKSWPWEQGGVGGTAGQRKKNNVKGFKDCV
jgi:hypothetical protein